MNCLFCNMPDRQYDSDVKEIICSTCVQVLSSQTQEKLRAAYQSALDKDMSNRAKAIATFLEDEEQDVRKAERSNRAMDRGRALRKTETAYHKVRPEHTVRQLDKRRFAVC